MSFHLHCPKTAGILGFNCIPTATSDEICPVDAFNNHRRVNQCSGSDPLDSDIPLFAYKEDNCWISLLKSTFLQITTNIYSMEGLDVVHKHSDCICGTLQLLLDGVTPETVMKIGKWSSLCFLIYWHPLEQIIPSAVTQSWDAKNKEFGKKFAHHENEIFK